ncbi:MAG: hypothetical protein AAFY46_14755 [Planctomycetota bacterium]
MSDRVTILHLGEGESRQAWKEALADRPWESGTLIKKDGEREVWQARVLGSVVSMKVRPAERIRAWLGTTDFARSVRATGWLLHKGFETPAVLARGVVGRHELLINEWVDGPTLLRLLADAGDVARRRDLFEAAGRLIGRLWRSGLVNRDHKPSNLVLRSRSLDHPHLLDVGGIRKRSRDDEIKEALRYRGEYRMIARMCASQVIEPRGVGIDVSPGDIELLVSTVFRVETQSSAIPQTYPNLAREVLRDVNALIESHGDATPKINPLDPPRP